MSSGRGPTHTSTLWCLERGSSDKIGERWADGNTLVGRSARLVRPGANAIVDAVLDSVRPGAIVLLHDGCPPDESGALTGLRDQTLMALSRIVPALHERGFAIRPLLRITEQTRTHVPADTTSTAAISIYALLLTAYRSMQVLYARPIDGPAVSAEPVETRPLPAVDVIVPSFNEDPGILSACLASIADQDYPGELRVYVVDDGSRNREAIVRVRAFYSRDPRFSFILLPENVGKRKAQIAAIGQSSGDLVLNVDSDSTIAFDVVSKLASKMRDPEVGAVMGQLTASNSGDTWLTKLIDMEYWLACNEERAAQSRFGAVMCCCGPCAMYRRSALASLLDQYETQLFRGKPSDFGEDRHLTILMLKAGFRTEYVPDAIVATVVPIR